MRARRDGDGFFVSFVLLQLLFFYENLFMDSWNFVCMLFGSCSLPLVVSYALSTFCFCIRALFFGRAEYVGFLWRSRLSLSHCAGEMFKTR